MPKTPRDHTAQDAARTPGIGGGAAYDTFTTDLEPPPDVRRAAVDRLSSHQRRAVCIVSARVIQEIEAQPLDTAVRASMIQTACAALTSDERVLLLWLLHNADLIPLLTRIA